VEPLSLQNAVLALASLLTLCVVSGVMTAVLVQQQRDRASLWFALFCFSLLLWSLSALVGPLRALRLGLDDEFRLKMLATAVGVSAVSFYLFIVQFANLRGSLVDILKRAAPIVLGGSLVIIWAGSALSMAESGDAAITTPGLLMLSAAVFYVAYALFLIWNSQDVRAPGLRIPALLLLVAYLTIISSELNRTPAAILLATAAAGLMGYGVLRFQWSDPLRSLADELRVTTGDLRQALADLAAERARNQRLTEEVGGALQK
jgi:hypothetical protein